MKCFDSGHEFPFAIQMNQHREMSILDDSDFIIPGTDPSGSQPIAVEISPESKLQFVLKKGRKMRSKGQATITALSYNSNLCAKIVLQNTTFLNRITDVAFLFSLVGLKHPFKMRKNKLVKKVSGGKPPQFDMMTPLGKYVDLSGDI